MFTEVEAAKDIRRYINFDGHIEWEEIVNKHFGGDDAKALKMLANILTHQEL